MVTTVDDVPSFSFDVIGRYVCNTIDEARASMDPATLGQARPFDVIVVGGGSFGSIAATHIFDSDRTHRHRVLVLEAGPVALPEHVQNLPPDLSPPPKNVPGTVWGVPWLSDSPQVFNRDFPGLAFCVGGRSVFWGGWSPYFIESELADPMWPAGVRRDLLQRVLPPDRPSESYLDQAARQLGTDTTNDFVSGPLHDALGKRLFEGLRQRPAGTTRLTGNRGALNDVKDLEAPLAVQSAPARPGTFPLNKFNAIQLLIRAARMAQSEAQQAAPFDPGASDTLKRLMVVNEAYVTRLVSDGRRVTGVELQTTTPNTPSRSAAFDVPAGGVVILGLGTIENTRMALNTVPGKALMGRNLMAHLRSNLTFRIPHSSFRELELTGELAVSALFVKGIHVRDDGSDGHFHIQITASGVGELSTNSEAELFKKIPNIDELDQFAGLDDRWIVVTLRAIGEMIGDRTSADPQNRIALGAPDGNGVPRALVRLETNPRGPADPRGDADNKLWKAMNDASIEVARMLAGDGEIQYLSQPNAPGNAVWQPVPPAEPAREDSLSSTHHEAGTLWMGSDPATSVTDEFGRIWELENLYVVGPALLPTIGSPNPMLSGTALSRRTAERIVGAGALPPLEKGFDFLFDGSERTYQRWRSAGPGSFALVDGLLVAEPGPPASIDDEGVLAPVAAHSVFVYAAEQFDDFVLRLQFRLAGPAGNRSGRPVDNSGVLLRFHAPHARGPDLPTNADPVMSQMVAADPAWVAAFTGFEVQIDERARPDGADRHRTGAVYAIPTNPGGLQDFRAAGDLQPGPWHDMEVTVRRHRYTVVVDGTRTADFLNPRNDFVIDPPGLPLRLRGLPRSEEPQSGYIGIQAHTGHVAFRSIMLRRLGP